MDNMNDILGHIENIKNRLGKLQKELEGVTVSGLDPDSLVTAVVNGKGTVIDYEFNTATLDDSLKNAIVQATNDGLNKAKKLEADKKREIVGDINLPNMPGLF